MNLELAAQWIIAAAAIAALVVTIFRQQIAHLCAGSRLRITIADPKGFWVASEGSEAALAGVWHYHLRVTNRWRSMPVSEVRVLLLRVEDLGSGVKWTGEAELQWRYDIPPPVLGPDGECDLCFVVDGVLRLGPVKSRHPPGQVKRAYRPGAHLRLFVQARGTESESPVTRFELKWQGYGPDLAISEIVR